MKIRTLIVISVGLLYFLMSSSLSRAIDFSNTIALAIKVSNSSVFYMGVVVADGQVIMIGRNPFAVVKLDPASGLFEIISDQTRGNGPIPENPLWGIALLPDGRIVSATELDRSIPRSIITIDPITGNRTVLSQADVRGEGPGLSMVDSVVVSQGQLFVTDKGFHNGIIQVDLATGNRKILSDAQHGAGPLLNGPLGIQMGEDRFLYVAYGGELKTIARVDPNTGARSIISDETRGTGPSFGSPWRVALLSNQQLAVADVRKKAIFIVDMKSGNRTILTDATRGQGPTLSYPFSLTYHKDGYLIVFDPSQGIIFRVDLITGDRAIIWKN